MIFLVQQVLKNSPILSTILVPLLNEIVKNLFISTRHQLRRNQQEKELDILTFYFGKMLYL